MKGVNRAGKILGMNKKLITFYFATYYNPLYLRQFSMERTNTNINPNICIGGKILIR